MRQSFINQNNLEKKQNAHIADLTLPLKNSNPHMRGVANYISLTTTKHVFYASIEQIFILVCLFLRAPKNTTRTKQRTACLVWVLWFGLWGLKCYLAISEWVLGLCVYKCGDSLLSEEFLLSSGLNLLNN